MSSPIYAQRGCTTVEYMSKFEDSKTKESFEQWIQQKKSLLPGSGLKSLEDEKEVTVYQIPIVVHIVHNGESLGVGSNISESQILSQIEALNKDYAKLNADSVNIPEEFKSLYANIGFEFILAKRDPDGKATNGITRIQGSKTAYSEGVDDAVLKSFDYWPSEDYLNIWVAPLVNPQLGWAHYPQSSLPGMVPPYDAATDGVVIAYDAFGSKDIDPSANLQNHFDLGRTATHEIGHFFGLRHIWGDGGCGFDDYVNDTPLAEDNYSGCPNLGASTTTCGSQDMFMNYMDYVYDDCMNLFTLGQKERMVIVIQNSPRRLSLTTSSALLPPETSDLALLSFTSPEDGLCSSTVYPSLEIKNVGTKFIDSAKISLKVNGEEIASKLFDLKLDVNQTQEVYFDEIELSTFGTIQFVAEVVTVNGDTDDYADDNSINKISIRPELVQSLSEDFSTTNPSWSLRTDQQVSNWDTNQAVFYSINNTSGVFNYYKATSGLDSYISPKLFVEGNDKTLLFDIAYGYREGFDDTFLVQVSTDCGATFPDTLFIAKGHELSTATTPVSFYPSGASEWAHHQLSLSKYSNQDVVFAFKGVSDGGNNIYLDNIRVVDGSYSDIALVGLPHPALVCDDDQTYITIENKGLEPKSNLNLKILQGFTTISVSYTQLSLQPGFRKEIVLPVDNFTGTAEATVFIEDIDSDSSNDTLRQTLINAGEQIDIPLREQFTGSSLPESWVLTGADTDSDSGWKLNNNYLEWQAHTSSAKGLKETIVLPPLNLENSLFSSLHFSRAYAYNGSDEELLRAKVSVNCGQTFETVYEEGGESLATSLSTSSSWAPSGEADWSDTYINLSSYAGYENVMVALELTSAQGGNMFVDNVEFYASNVEEPLPLKENMLTVYPNPVSNGTVHLTINLSEAQAAQLTVLNSQGATVLSYDIPKALNQTLDIPAYNMQSGIYFVKFISRDQSLIQRFVINN
ncbi:MAG: choice-of-anchor J domain-containing protein [Cyclobacteriaceae bacterium]|nr:choice-of-anchor J domain-containing protein [Cyclobacteriaceae bacterium]